MINILHQVGLLLSIIIPHFYSTLFILKYALKCFTIKQKIKTKNHTSITQPKNFEYLEIKLIIKQFKKAYEQNIFTGN